MRDHTKLRAFELADELVLLIYKVTMKFPREEMYGLTSQLRRAGVSVASNIVEGCARESQEEYIRFLEIAFSSLREVHYQISLSERLGFLNQQNGDICVQKATEAGKVLAALLRSLRQGRNEKG